MGEGGGGVGRKKRREGSLKLKIEWLGVCGEVVTRESGIAVRSAFPRVGSMLNKEYVRTDKKDEGVKKADVEIKCDTLLRCYLHCRRCGVAKHVVATLMDNIRHAFICSYCMFCYNTNYVFKVFSSMFRR